MKMKLTSRAEEIAEVLERDFPMTVCQEAAKLLKEMAGKLEDHTSDSRWDDAYYGQTSTPNPTLSAGDY
jgi:hypothetical protein